MAKNKVDIEAYGWSYDDKSGVAVGIYGDISIEIEITVAQAKALRKNLKEAIAGAGG